MGDLGEAGKFHTSVLLKEAIDGLEIEPGEKYIDCTLGGGGHAEEILKRGGIVLGIDCDEEAIDYVGKNLTNLPNGTNLKLAKGNFKDLEEIAVKNGFEKVSGILFDLGVSTHQLLTTERGFSFQSDSLLDMRMDQELAVKAADLVNGLNEGELYELFIKLGEEHHAWAIARALVCERALKSIKTGRELAQIVGGVRGLRNLRGKLHPATKVFQALRIAVNDELNNLKEALPQAWELLEKKGRLVVISFHSLEDRIVKNFFKEQEQKGKLEILTKKPIAPSSEEIMGNQKSRSAKMRVAKIF